MNIRAPDPGKYALNLMDVLFTDEEMRGSCFVATARTKKPALDITRVALLEGK